MPYTIIANFVLLSLSVKALAFKFYRKQLKNLAKLF